MGRRRSADARRVALCRGISTFELGDGAIERDAVDCVGRQRRDGRVGRIDACGRHRRLCRGQPRRRRDVRRAGARQRRRRRCAAQRRAAAARRVRGTAITVVWTTKGAHGTKLVQARSDDGGRTFAKATRGAWRRRGGQPRLGKRRRRSRRPRLRGVARSSRPGATGRRGRRIASRPRGHARRCGCRPEAGRRRDGAAIEAVSGVARRRRRSARAHRRRLLLLQDGARHAPATDPFSPHGATCIPATSATSPSPPRTTAAGRSRRRCASARTSGCSRGARTMVRRWPWTRRAACTSCGRR